MKARCTHEKFKKKKKKQQHNIKNVKDVDCFGFDFFFLIFYFLDCRLSHYYFVEIAIGFREKCELFLRENLVVSKKKSKFEERRRSK